MKAARIAALACTTALLLGVLWTTALAQRPVEVDSDPSGRVARLNYLRGPVSFEPAGETEWVSAVVNRPMTTGDRLWAEDGGRVEMQLGSATIRLGALTGMSFLNLDDRTTQVELSEGSLNVRVLRMDRDDIFEIDTPNQAFSILRPGQYRIDASEDGNSTMVTVRDGEGEVTGGGRTYTVGAGLSGDFSGGDSLHASIFKSGGYDDFDTWCQDRDRRNESSPSKRYVSVEVVGYQDLDDYGYWRSDPSYGYIWIPRVANGWAPYHDGHWVWISPWGWTWVDDAPWGYAPFHYGRWVYSGNYWGWVPGPIAVRPVYAPALVVFVGGPRFSVSVSIGNRGSGYVGWFPLGPREVYVPSYHTSREYVNRVNVTNTTVNNITITNVYNNSNNTSFRYSNKNVRGGVTAVSQTTFTSAQPVGRSVVALNAQEIASAPVNRRAEVAPTRSSVLGPSSSGNKRVSQPPAQVMNRTIVAKHPVPPPVVPFERQQAKLAAQPGQPLAANEIETLRPANGSSERSRVRQAPPGRSAAADSNQAPANLPVGNAAGRGGNRGSQTPSAQVVPAPAVANPPAAVNAPATREDRPPSRGNRGQAQANVQAQTPSPAPAVTNSPAGNSPSPRPAIRDDRPNGGNRGQQAPNVQVAPAPAVTNPPAAVNAPATGDDRPQNRGNRGQPQSNIQAPAPSPAPSSAPAVSNSPASNASPTRPSVRDDRSSSENRGAAQSNNAPAPDPVRTPSNPPARNSPPARGASRGPSQQAPQTQSPEPSPATKVASPASSNSQGRGNRDQ